MKRLTLTRTSRGVGYTTGILHEEGKILCYTLEPQWRNLKHEKKVMGLTAIPEGKYRFGSQLSGTHNDVFRLDSWSQDLRGLPIAQVDKALPKNR